MGQTLSTDRRKIPSVGRCLKTVKNADVSYGWPLTKKIVEILPGFSQGNEHNTKHHQPTVTI